MNKKAKPFLVKISSGEFPYLQPEGNSYAFRKFFNLVLCSCSLNVAFVA
jgi:hypothetical protein